MSLGYVGNPPVAVPYAGIKDPATQRSMLEVEKAIRELSAAIRQARIVKASITSDEIGSRVFQGATVSLMNPVTLSSGTVTVIDWDVANYDECLPIAWDGGAPSQLTVDTDSRIIKASLTANIIVTIGGVVGLFYRVMARILQNGSPAAGLPCVEGLYNGTRNAAMSLSGIGIPCVVGDFFELEVTSLDVGSTLEDVSGTSFSIRADQYAGA